MTKLREAVICEPIRTPVGRIGGMFRDIPASALAAYLLRALIERTGIDAVEVDDVILGQGYPNGESPNIGRIAALDAGFPVSVPGVQVDRRCGAGLQAILYGAMAIQTGVSELILAGGAESMSQVELYSNKIRHGVPGAVTLEDRLVRSRINAGGVNYPVPGGMVETAENLRRAFSISREDQDGYALMSHERAIAAQDAGRFEHELIPITVQSANGPAVVMFDEHPRRDTSLEQLSSLSPIMLHDDIDSTVTAGNSSGQNDGAALCIVTTRQNAERLGLRPLARLHAWALAGVAPERMGIGPVPAASKALDRAGLRLSDIDLIELNEAFAAQVLAVTSEWKFVESDFDRLNVNGSGISLGHPIGATGARILATLLWEMDRRDVRYGLETMCIGGGQGIAAIFERLN